MILIAGKQGSGKTTLALKLKFALHAFHLKFADPLYEMHEAIRPVAEKYGIPFGSKEGVLLQLLGTEWGRRCKGDDVWANACKNHITSLNKTNPKATIIVDDCRFENELNKFPLAFKVRLIAPGSIRSARAESWRDNELHQSETGLDHVTDDKFDLVVHTDQFDADETFQMVLYAFKRFQELNK